MKRILFITLLFYAAFFSSCKKNTDPSLPAINWASNPNFTQMELAPGADGAISIAAPGGFESITLSLGLGMYNLLANPYISTSANKGSSTSNPVFDVIDDAKTAEFLSGMGMSGGSKLRGQTIATLNLITILETIIAGQELSNNTSFTMEILVQDKSANMVKKNAKFHFTAAPSFVWDGNSKFETIDLNADKVPAKVKLQVPGKVAKLTVTLDSGAPALEKYIKNRTTGGTNVIDLVGDEKVETSFSGIFPAGKNVSGKTDVTLDFSFMYSQSYDLEDGYTNVFTIYVQDANGKDATQQVKFKK